MSVARSKKAFSTLMLDLALTSRKGMPSSSARAWPFSVDTTRLSSQSHLLPIRILLTPSVACCSTLENQVRMSAQGLFVSRGPNMQVGFGMKAINSSVYCDGSREKETYC